MVHIASLCKVYLGLDDGSVLMYDEKLPSGLSTEIPTSVRFVPLVEYVDAKQISSSLLAIERIEMAETDQATVTIQQPTKTTHELWVGQTSGFVTVLNAETLTVITYIYNPFDISRLPNQVAFLVTNHLHNIYYDDSESCENSDTVCIPQNGILTVYGAVYEGQFVTRWNVKKRRAAESCNCEKHLGGEGTLPWYNNIAILP